MGRPSVFTQEVVEGICKGLMEGKSLAAVCRQDGMPSPYTVMNWLNKGDSEPDKYPEYRDFLNDYTRAREYQADVFADEVIEIADTCLAENDSIQKAKVRIDARKWSAGKMRPQKYGVVKPNAQDIGDAMVEYVTAIKASPNEES